MLTVIEPAATRRLVSLARARDLLGLSEADASDLRLGAWLDRASAAAESFTGRVFARERVRETVPVTDGVALLGRSPVTAVHTASVGERVLETDGYLLTDAAVGTLRLVDLADGWPHGGASVSGRYGVTGRGIGRYMARAVPVTVEYTAGYDLTLTPGTAGALPADVEAAILAAVERIAIQGRAVTAGQRLGAQSESMGDYSYTLRAGAERQAEAYLGDGSMMGLGRYRRVVL